ncbi:zinc finger CCCH domain-containing protein 13-like isoform X36 [Crassostrea angulata]|uniref:zinc finger CCCH domain-containing protein 13-like isoform X36 n=1 Tax=Magallana angulata TaxID=2784310 RepID=UPI0022B14F69|nr:zinc finger CCCH domain-containing protein 13-like isoform X36 [Crassostrea angulata]
MALRVDVNKGPLTLTHDPRPRDLKTSNNTSTDNPLYQDFRFKGYPSEGFFNPHNPQYKRNSAAEMNGTDTSRYFGKTQHFDTGFERAKTDRPSARPRATPPMRSSSGMDNARPKIDEGHKSLQYGSNDPRIAESQQVRPGPMRGMDFDRGENDRDRLRKEMVETEQDRQRIRYQEQLRMRDRDEERKRHEDMLEQRRQDRVGYDPSGPRDRTRFEQMKRDPEMQQKQESLRNQEEKLHTLKQELDHLKAAATDRRPGNHLRLKRKLYNSMDAIELMKVQARDSFQERRQLDEYDPWGKGIGNPLRNSDGYLKNIRRSFRSRKNGYGDSYERGGNPRTAPDTYRSATNPFEEYDNLGRTGKPRKPNMEMHPIYHPFGRSGGGAPVKDDAGKVNTILHGHSDRHYLSNNLSDYEKRQNAIKAKIYYAELGEQLEVQNYKRQKEKEEKRRPHGELAVIIDDKLTGKPRRDPITGSLRNHHLGNSDVSLQKMGSQPRNIAEQKQYHDFLDNMNEERSRKNALGKMKDFQEGKKHYDTMDNLWGRPGGGAPKGYTMRKFNLDEIIHRPTHDKATEEYVRKHDWSEVEPEKFFLKDDDAYYATQRSPRQNPMLSARDIQEGRLSPGSMPKKFIKSTVTSTHANMYDYREDYPQKDYRVGAPYATVNEG